MKKKAKVKVKKLKPIAPGVNLYDLHAVVESPDPPPCVIDEPEPVDPPEEALSWFQKLFGK